MTVTGGRVVVTPGEAQPYKVVLKHEQTTIPNTRCLP